MIEEVHVAESHVEEFSSQGTSPPTRRRFGLAHSLALLPVERVAIRRARYPQGLVCVRCARLLATRRESYATLTEEQHLSYVCAECRRDETEAAQKAQLISESFARSKAVAGSRQLRPPLSVTGAVRGPDGWGTETVRLADDTLVVKAAEAECGRRFDHPYVGTCLLGGQHDDPVLAAECAGAFPRIPPASAMETFCAHARPTAACIFHRLAEPQKTATTASLPHVGKSSIRTPRNIEPGSVWDKSRRSRWTGKRIRPVRRATPAQLAALAKATAARAARRGLKAATEPAA